MSEFESRIGRDSSESEDRSRSDRVVCASALQVRAGTPSDPISSASMSTPDDRNPNRLQNVTNPNQSPDGTLSQFWQSAGHSPNVPRNPIQTPLGQGMGPEGSPGPSFTQTDVRNELHISMDPFVLAQANQAIRNANSAFQQSRQELRLEAISFAGRVQEEARAETLHIVGQSEANRVIGESQIQVAQSQSELNATRVEATEALNRASQELEAVKAQCRIEIESFRSHAATEFMSLKVEAQNHGLKGSWCELVHINAQPQERLIAQTKQSEMLMKQLQEKEGAYDL